MADDAQYDPLTSVLTPQALAMMRYQQAQKQMQASDALSGREAGAAMAGMGLGQALSGLGGPPNTQMDRVAASNAGTITEGMSDTSPTGPTDPTQATTPYTSQIAAMDRVSNLFQQQNNMPAAMAYRDKANILRKQEQDYLKSQADQFQAYGKGNDAQAHAQQSLIETAQAVASKGAVIIGSADGTEEYARIPTVDPSTGKTRPLADVQQDINKALANSKDDQAQVVSQDKWALNKGQMEAQRQQDRIDLAKMKQAVAQAPLGQEALNFAYQTYKQTGALPQGYSSRSGAMQAQVWNYIAQQAKADGNEAGYFTAQKQSYLAAGKALNSITSGSDKKTIDSINTAVMHLGVFEPLIDQLQNGTFTPANAAKNWTAQKMGAPAPTNFNAVKQFVTEEISKAVMPGGGGEQEREALAKQAADANSPEALKSVVGLWKQLLAGKTDALHNDWDVVTKGTHGDFSQFLLPATKAALGQPDQQQAGGAPGAAGAAPSAEGSTGTQVYKGVTYNYKVVNGKKIVTGKAS